MKTVGQIFSEDVRRMLHTPLALVAALFVVIVACFCAWLSIGALWNPYQNLDKLTVAVVNEDAGTQLSGKSLNIGEQLVEALGEDDQLAWDIVDAETAEAGLRSGAYYAEIIVPSGFSEDFVGILSGNSKHPTVQYWTNAKHGSSELRVADNGAGAVDASIEKEFSDVLTGVIGDVAKGIASDAASTAGATGSGVRSGLDRASLVITGVSDNLLRASDAINQWRDSVSGTSSTLDSLRSNAASFSGSVANTQTLLASARTSAHNLSAAYTGGLAQGGDSIITTVKQVVERVRQVSSYLTTAQTELQSAIQTAKATLRQNEQLLTTLQGMVDEHPELKDQVASLQTQNEELSATVSSLEAAAADVSTAASDASKYAEDTAKQVDSTITDIMNGDSNYNSNVMPALDTSMDSLAISLGSLESAVSGLDGQIAQAQSLVTQLNDVLTRTQVILDKTVSSIATASMSLLAARYDLAAIASSGIGGDSAGSQSGAASYARLMSSQVDAVIQPVYASTSNGALTAPFYLCLTLWLAALMLVAVFRRATVPASCPDASPRRAYLARLLLLFLITVITALVACMGCVTMGVEAASVPALLLAALFVAFAFIGIVFSMAVSYGPVGKALAVAFLVVQIPVVAGTYPLGLMPEVFQALAPWMPLAHGVGAMEEAIDGFYGLNYAVDLLWLLGCGLAALAFGLIVRPYAPGAVEEAPDSAQFGQGIQSGQSSDYDEFENDALPDYLWANAEEPGLASGQTPEQAPVPESEPRQEAPVAASVIEPISPLPMPAVDDEGEVGR